MGRMGGPGFQSTNVEEENAGFISDPMNLEEEGQGVKNRGDG